MIHLNKNARDVGVQVDESGANTPTDRASRTILDVANDIRSDGTRTFAQDITRLISESRDAQDYLVSISLYPKLRRVHRTPSGLRFGSGVGKDPTPPTR